MPIGDTVSSGSREQIVVMRLTRRVPARQCLTSGHIPSEPTDLAQPLDHDRVVLTLGDAHGLDADRVVEGIEVMSPLWS